MIQILVHVLRQMCDTHTPQWAT